MMKLNLRIAAMATLMASAIVAMPAQAQQRIKLNTSSGQFGATQVVGPNGGSAGCVSGVRYGISGGRTCGVRSQNGYAYTSSGAKEGVGVYRRSGRSYTNPITGNSTSSSSTRGYNARTDKGGSSVSRDKTIGGTSYGYDKNKTYTYTPGSGYSGTTTVTTDNKGTYTCSYTSGSTRTCTQP